MPLGGERFTLRAWGCAQAQALLVFPRWVRVRTRERRIAVRAFAVLLLAGQLGACADSGKDARLQFSITHSERLGRSTAPLHLRPDSLAVEGGVGSVQVTGTVWLPDRCDDLRANLVDRRPELDLRLRHRQLAGHRGECDEADRSVLVEYRARIGGLPPGRYRIRVLGEGHVEHGRLVWSPRGADGPARHLYDDTVLVR